MVTNAARRRAPRHRKQTGLNQDSCAFKVLHFVLISFEYAKSPSKRLVARQSGRSYCLYLYSPPRTLKTQCYVICSPGDSGYYANREGAASSRVPENLCSRGFGGHVTKKKHSLGTLLGRMCRDVALPKAALSSVCNPLQIQDSVKTLCSGTSGPRGSIGSEEGGRRPRDADTLTG